MDDPLTAVLDRIQAGNFDDATVRYFSSRVLAGEAADDAVDKAVVMVKNRLRLSRRGGRNRKRRLSKS
jgi:hypothetical protein